MTFLSNSNFENLSLSLRTCLRSHWDWSEVPRRIVYKSGPQKDLHLLHSLGGLQLAFDHHRHSIQRSELFRFGLGHFTQTMSGVSVERLVGGVITCHAWNKARNRTIPLA
jgi:hypothetical protein